MQVFRGKKRVPEGNGRTVWKSKTNFLAITFYAQQKNKTKQKQAVCPKAKYQLRRELCFNKNVLGNFWVWKRRLGLGTEYTQLLFIRILPFKGEQIKGHFTCQHQQLPAMHFYSPGTSIFNYS